MHERDVRHGISRLRHSFQRNPLNYMSAGNVAADLRDELRKWADPVNVTCQEVEESAGYKQNYIDSLCRDGQNVYAVQMDVLVGSPEDHRVFDVVILADESTIQVYNGRVYVTPDSVKHAVRVRYIPEENLVQPSFFDEDIEQLTWLDDGGRWLLAANNKNVFQHQKRDRKYSDRAKKYREALEDRCEEEAVHLEEIHP